MGTLEQKAHREKYLRDFGGAWDAAGVKWMNDQQLKDYLSSMGLNPEGPIFKQLYSGGGYSTYGPSWNPGLNQDFVTGEEIPWMGEGETWYDPSDPAHWSKTNPLKLAREKGYYDWRDKVQSQIDADPRFGGNTIAAWKYFRSKSDRPNAPDMAWYNEGNGPAIMAGRTMTPTPPAPLSTSTPLGATAPATPPGVTAQSKYLSRNPTPMPSQPYGYASMGQPYGYSSVKPPRPARRYSLGG